MPDSIEQTIATAKEEKRKANSLDTLKYMKEEGILPGEDSEKPSAFANSAVKIADAQHNAHEENVQQTHSNIKESIIAPIIEIALIQEAAEKENASFKHNRTVDQLTQLENDIFVKEIGEAHTDILQLLVSVDARGRNDANVDLASLVAGEQARALAEAGQLQVKQSSGLVGALKRIVGK